MNEEIKTIPLPVEWTDDCQGKKDYDGDLVTISTRYWPRGGGISVLDATGFKTNGDQSILPSAHSTIYLGETVKLADREFEGETQEEVQRAVEDWAQEQFARICAVLRREFHGTGAS
jgi:hypothetical protein